MIPIIIILCILLSSTPVSAVQVQNHETIKQHLKQPINNYEIDTPTWEIGDTWTYNMEIEGELGEALTFKWGFRDLFFNVESDQGSTYSMTMDGKVTGEITIYEIDIISGSLKDTTVTGEITIEKSTLGLKKIDAHIAGKIAVADIPLKPFTMDIDITINPAFNAVDFPLTIGKQWVTPTCDVIGTVEFSLLKNPIYIDDLIGGDFTECTGVETITVEAGTYEAFIILSDGDASTKYYAEDAGNIIKAFGNKDQYIDITLKSTTYGVVPGAPNRPSTPKGPTKGKPGKSYTYSSSAVDNEGDDIYYLFDWGDGTNSGWLGPYPSGKTVSRSHKWSSIKSYTVRVRAMDVEHHKSKWSFPLTVNMPRAKPLSNNLSSQLISEFLKIFHTSSILQKLLILL